MKVFPWILSIAEIYNLNARLSIKKNARGGFGGGGAFAKNRSKFNRLRQKAEPGGQNFDNSLLLQMVNLGREADREPAGNCALVS
ncbi:MAG: hypothetical protein HY579_13475 [Nitrospinae bacterium]|nr:hypothetical protein [Nitrospinota bacterium]